MRNDISPLLAGTILAGVITIAVLAIRNIEQEREKERRETWKALENIPVDKDTILL